MNWIALLKKAKQSGQLDAEEERLVEDMARAELEKKLGAVSPTNANLPNNDREVKVTEPENSKLAGRDFDNTGEVPVKAMDLAEELADEAKQDTKAIYSLIKSAWQHEHIDIRYIGGVVHVYRDQVLKYLNGKHSGGTNAKQKRRIRRQAIRRESVSTPGVSTDNLRDWMTDTQVARRLGKSRHQVLSLVNNPQWGITAWKVSEHYALYNLKQVEAAFSGKRISVDTSVWYSWGLLSYVADEYGISSAEVSVAATKKAIASHWVGSNLRLVNRAEIRRYFGVSEGRA